MAIRWNGCLVFLLSAWAVGSLQAEEAKPVRAGEPQAGALSDSTPSVRYAFTITEPSYLLGDVTQVSVDVAVRLVGPDKKLRAEFDSTESGPERFARRLDEPGEYQLELVRAEDDEKDGDAGEGEYSLRLLRLEPLAKDPAALTDQAMALYDLPGSPGAAVQVWRDGKTIFSRSYGLANLVFDVPFEIDTRTNIGSTSKQFTAFALLLEQERGALQLDDDIRKYVPEVPDFGPTITIRHLLTHTSGLREFINLLMMAGRRIDRGDWIDRSEILDIVKRQPALQNEPGAEWNYNNTAFGLAALIVERTSGLDFHEFMTERVFGPLGMTRTMVRPSPKHIVPQSSEGYAPWGDGFVTVGDIGAAVGAGSIYASVGDLQTWVEHLLDPRLGTAEMVREMTTPHPASVGKAMGGGYGLGLFLDEQRGLRRIHHGGSDMAHRSMLAYYPEIRAGITVQSNHAGFNSSVAFELAEAFFGDAMEPEPADKTDAAAEAESEAWDASAFAPEDFDAFVGRYSLDPKPAFILTFSREEDRFFTQATGQPKLEIRPVAPRRFELVGVPAEVEFLVEGDGTVEGLTLFQNGEHHATRLEGDEAKGWKPTPAELERYAGRYTSRELESFCVIRLDGDKLVVRHPRREEAAMDPGDEDEFSQATLQYAFERDRNGVVIGLYLSNGRTRDVRFARDSSH